MLNRKIVRRTLGAACIVALAQCGSDPGTGPVITATTIEKVTGDAQTGGVGDSLPIRLTVKVTGAGGAAVFGYVVHFDVASGGGGLTSAVPGQGFIASTVAATDDAGIASVTWNLGSTLGPNSQTVTASAPTLTGSPLTFTASTVPGSPASLTVVSGDHQTAEVGQPLAQPLVVLVKDKYGNNTQNQPINWTVVGGGGSLPGGAVTTTDITGQASQTWTLGYTAGTNGQALRAQFLGNPLATVTLSATGTLTAGQLSISAGNGQLGAASARLVGPLRVLVRAPAPGNQPVAGVPVQWLAHPGHGAVDSATTTTDAQGVASNTWVLGSSGGSDTAEASVAGLTPGSVVFAATAIVPQPSSITGQVSVANGFFAPPAAAGGFRFGLSAAGPNPRLAGDPTVRLQPTNYLSWLRSRPKYSRNDLIVTFRASALRAPPAGALITMSAATAQAITASIRTRLAGVESPGRVHLSDVSPVLLAARLRVANPAEVDSVAGALRADPGIATADRDRMVYPDGAALANTPPGVTIPNDPNYPNQSWHYAMVDLPRAWNLTTGSTSVIVADVDNGIRFNHPALAPNLTADGYDFVSSGAAQGICNGLTIDNADDGDGYDPDPSIPADFDLGASGTCLDLNLPSQLGGHGVHTAGLIGAQGNDGNSVVGANWHVKIRPVRVLGLSGGSTFDVAQGVLYAAGIAVPGKNGAMVSPAGGAARIINLSLGGSCPGVGEPDVLHDAVVAATNAGALVVASAGNGGSSIPSCPAAYPEAVSVSAVGPTGAIASFSNFGSAAQGSKIDIAAPGGEFPAGNGDGTTGIFSSTCDFTTTPCTPNQARYFGTSQAAPHVSGIAALILALSPGLTVSQLKTRLFNYAVPAGSSDLYGAGIVNARNSLTQTLAPATALYVRLIDATTGATVATQAAPGGNFNFGNLADGSYYVFAGEDENADGVIGVPGRRWGAFGGAATPTPIAVTTTAGGTAFFSVGYANSAEPNEANSFNSLVVGGYLHSQLPASDSIDVFQVRIPTGGQYTFQTSGWFGAYCKFALDVNTIMTLADANHSVITSNDDTDPNNNNYCSTISTTLNPGTYYITVTAGLNFGAPPTIPQVTQTGRYRVEARSGP